MSGEPLSSSSNGQTEAGSETGTLSLSMAGGCRMRLWLKAHGFQPEPVAPSTQRTFDYGDAIEWLMFDGLRIPSSHDESGFKEAGNWWNKAEVVREPKLGLFFSPAKSPIVEGSRQMTVKLGPFVGHIDGYAYVKFETGDEEEETIMLPTLVDCKSANTWSYKRACGEDLTLPALLGQDANVFTREYVITQNCYMKAMRDAGIPIQRGVLLYANKEIGHLMFRLLPFYHELAEEGLERLTTGTQKAEPRPDYDWKKGADIPLRCGYCEQKHNCAIMRGMPISDVKFDKGGKPSWSVL